MTQRLARSRLLALGTLAACAGAPPMPDPADTHPASPAATAAPTVPPTDTLAMPPRTPKAAVGQPDAMRMRGR